MPLATNQEKGFTHYAGIILSIIVRQKIENYAGIIVTSFGGPSEIWALVLWLCSKHSTCQVLLIQHSFVVSEVIHYYRNLISQQPSIIVTNLSIMCITLIKIENFNSNHEWIRVDTNSRGTTFSQKLYFILSQTLDKIFHYLALPITLKLTSISL